MANSTVAQQGNLATAEQYARRWERNVYEEHTTGTRHTVCAAHGDEILEPCWWVRGTNEPCEVCGRAA